MNRLAATVLLAGCSVSAAGGLRWGEPAAPLPEALRNADAAPGAVICDPRHPHHFGPVDGKRFVTRLWRATVQGDVIPEVATECVARLGVSPELTAGWYGRLVDHVVRRTTRRKPAEPVDARRLRAMVASVENVPLHEYVSPSKRERWRSRLEKREEIAKRSEVAALREVLDLNDGRYRGTVLDRGAVARIDDAALLRRIARVLPDAAVRQAALEAWVARKVELSDWPGLKAEAAAVTRRVVETGQNAIAEREVSLESLRFDDDRLAALTVVVDQNTRRARVKLRLDADGSPQAAWAAGSLRGALWVTVGGAQRPITVCGPRDEFLVEPCLHPAAIDLRSKLMTVAADGRLVVKESMKMARFTELVVEGWHVPLAAKVVEVEAEPARLPMQLRPMQPLQFQGASAGTRGQGLTIVLRDVGGHVLFRLVADGDGERSGFAAYADGRFELASVGAPGAQGARGSPGANGTTGTAGRNASCPSSNGTSGGPGGDGKPGGRGGNGGNGGDGGAVTVELHCSSETCGQLDAFARSHVHSRGGPGGRGGTGGPGGKGGSGGRGGSGTSCTDGDSTKSLSGGSSGSSGRNGSKGPDGMPGKAGRAQPIAVRRVEI